MAIIMIRRQRGRDDGAARTGGGIAVETAWHASSAVRMVAVVVMLVAVGCSPHGPGAPPSAPTAAPTVLDVGKPYETPSQPPQESNPLDVQPSKDANHRLSKVLTGTLVDSGAFHDNSFNPGDPMSSDAHGITFTTPSGHITCTGVRDSLVCLSSGPNLPRPPRPVVTPSGNWVPYLEFADGRVTYGVAAGGPMVPAKGRTLAYGSTLRFGQIECLSARDGITCADLDTSTGFHLSRDDLTPLKSVDALAPDLRVEPRTPGNAFCGALVSPRAVDDAAKSLPNNGGLRWMSIGLGDAYTCRDLQLFEVGTNDDTNSQPPLMPTYVLVFDRGQFKSSATDHPYPGLSGDLDPSDPTLIRLRFEVVNDGHESRATIRARYHDGVVSLLEPIPAGARPAT